MSKTFSQAQTRLKTVEKQMETLSAEAESLRKEFPDLEGQGNKLQPPTFTGTQYVASSKSAKSGGKQGEDTVKRALKKANARRNFRPGAPKGGSKNDEK